MIVIAVEFAAIFIVATLATTVLASLVAGYLDQRRERQQDRDAESAPTWLTPGTYICPDCSWSFTWTGVGWLGPVFEDGKSYAGDRLMDHSTMVGMYSDDWAAIDRHYGPRARYPHGPRCAVCLCSPGMHDRFKHQAKGIPVPGEESR